MRKKRNLLICILIFALLITISAAFQSRFSVAATPEDELEERVEEQLHNVDLSMFAEIVSGLTEQQRAIFGSGSFMDKLNLVLSGDLSLNYGNVFTAVFSIVFADVIRVLPFFAAIIGIAILFSILDTMKSGKESIAYFACYGAVILISSGVIVQLITYVRDTIMSMQAQMNAAFPVLLTMMTALGNTGSYTVYQPLVLILSTTVTNIMSVVILPMFIVSFIINIVGNLSPSIKLDKLAGFVSSASKWIVGIVFTVFMAFLSVQGITAAISDGISIKTAKYAISHTIPIVGGYLSDGFNLILAGSMLIKNAVGYSAIFLLLASVASPIIMIAIVSLLLKLCAAVTEPLSNLGVSKYLSDVSKSLNMLIAVIISVAFMYFITVMIIICTGNNALR